MSGNNLLASVLKSTMETTSDAPAWIRTFKKLLTASLNDSQPLGTCAEKVHEKTREHDTPPPSMHCPCHKP
jgi:hypothetical protein